jgi:hypothetical protein
LWAVGAVWYGSSDRSEEFEEVEEAEDDDDDEFFSARFSKDLPFLEVFPPLLLLSCPRDLVFLSLDWDVTSMNGVSSSPSLSAGVYLHPDASRIKAFALNKGLISTQSEQMKDCSFHIAWNSLSPARLRRQPPNFKSAWRRNTMSLSHRPQHLSLLGRDHMPNFGGS